MRIIPSSPTGPIILQTHTHSNFYQTSAKQSFGSMACLFIAPVPSSVAFSLLMIMKPTKPCNTQHFKQPGTCVMVWHINRVRDVSDCRSAVCCQQSAVLAVVVILNSSELWYKRELGAKINHVTDREIPSNGHNNLKTGCCFTLKRCYLINTLRYLYYICRESIRGSSIKNVSLRPTALLSIGRSVVELYQYEEEISKS